jgi:dolichol-phosphate mannosyltransferase
MQIKKKNIGIILPVYNEYKNIFKLLNQINFFFKRKLIVIIDDSEDNRIQNDLKKQKNIIYIKRNCKLGRGTAVIRGLKILLKKKIDIFIEMDTDLSSHPKELPKNINYFLKQQLDLLIMSRYLPKSRINNWPIRRRIFSFLTNKLTRLLLRVPVTDYTMGFRIYSKAAAKHISLSCGKIGSGFIILSEILLELYNNKYKIEETATIFNNRVEGKSSVNFKLLLESLYGLIKLFFKKK